MSKNINLAKTDISSLFEELESVAVESKIEEKKRKDYVETTKTDISNLFSELEKASQETKKINKKDKNKLDEFAGLFKNLSHQEDDEQKEDILPDLVTDIEPISEDNEEISEEIIKEDLIYDESPEVEKPKPPNDIVEKIIETLGDVRYQAEVKEEVDPIQSLKNEFQEFKRKLAKEVYWTGSGGGEVRLEFLDDVQSSTAKVDGKFLKFDSSSGKFVGDDASVSNETIQDIVGAMVSSNTESGITVTYQDGDGTLDFTVGTLNQDTTGNAATATALETGRTINGTSFDGSANITVTAAAGTLTGSTLNSGVTASSLTSVGTLTSLTVDNIIVNGTTIGHTDDTDLITLADGLVTVAGNLTVSGTTTTVNQTVVNVTDAFVFEGANADAHETTFRVDEPTADRKASLQDKTGTIALLSGFKINATDGSASNEGDFIVLDTSADDGDRLLFEDGTTDPIAVLASHGISLSGQGWNAFQFDNG